MNYKFRNLVFEGGGVKGIAYGGALKLLQESGYLTDIIRVAGTSAGAINATLLALGFSTEDVSRIIAETNFASFEDHSRFLPSNIARILNKFGWNKGDAFKNWMGDLIKSKAGKTDFTFGELEEEITGGNVKSFKYLYVASTNLQQQSRVVFSHEPERYKNLAIKDAVRMSMSIPLYFAAFNYESDLYVDGGVSYNFPINLFDEKRYLVNIANGEETKKDNIEHIFNHETLGFRLDSSAVIEYAKRDWASPPEKINGIKTYAGALLNFMMEMANKSHLDSNDWNRTIFIDTLDVKTTDFQLPIEKINALIASGEKGVKDYFAWRNKNKKWAAVPV